MKNLQSLIIFTFILAFIPSFKADDSPSKVYFTRNLSSHSIVEIYKKLNPGLSGKIALKVHSGEAGGPYFLKPQYLYEIYNYTNGTFVECNTAYPMTRHNTSIHKDTIEKNGWTNKKRRFVLMDEDELDEALEIPNSRVIEKNYVGKKIYDFESCLVLSHFKGHMMGGFGGALKQLSIGFASRRGKTNIHTAGATDDWTKMGNLTTGRKAFTSGMAEAASSVVKYFRDRKGIAFIHVIKDVSIACDCGTFGIPPRINDIGILASTDPVAIDQAALNLVMNSGDEGVQELKDQIARLLGENTVDYAEKLGIGSRKYTLIDIDKKSTYVKYSLGFIFIILGIILF